MGKAWAFGASRVAWPGWGWHDRAAEYSAEDDDMPLLGRYRYLFIKIAFPELLNK